MNWEYYEKITGIAFKKLFKICNKILLHATTKEFI